MTLRDRLVLMCVLVVAVLGAAWVLVVSPERKKAGELGTQLTAAQAQLSAAESQLASARSAQSRYAAAYGQIVSLGKAVPTSQEVPSLIFEIAKASQQRNVDFAAIATSSSGAGGAGGSSTPSAAGAASAAFAALPFSFTFSGSYLGLEHMLHGLTALTTRSPAGALQVSGRLLTISSVKLTPLSEPGKSGQQLSASIVADAYELPPESTTTATARSSTGTAPAASSASPSTTPPAIVRVKP